MYLRRRRKNDGATSQKKEASDCGAIQIHRGIKKGGQCLRLARHKRRDNLFVRGKTSRAVRGNKIWKIFTITSFPFDIGNANIMLTMSMITIGRGRSLRIGTSASISMQAITSMDSTSTDKEQHIEKLMKPESLWKFVHESRLFHLTQ